MNRALTEYLEYVRQPETDWNLFRASLHLCRIISNRLDFKPYFKFVDHLVAKVRDGLGADDDVYTVINGINKVLYEKFSFQGDSTDYYNPLNSYMTFVMERRKGIPITLCLLYREIASQLGLKLDCVAMPGHFLLKCRVPSREIFIDAFSRGQILLEDECFHLLSQAYDGNFQHRREYLASTPNRVVLLRMLGNLKNIYREQGNSPLLLEILERRIPLLSNPVSETLERGLVRINTEDYRGALKDLEYFLENSSNQKTKKVIEKQIDRVRRLASAN